jgi:hypothetical protein
LAFGVDVLSIGDEEYLRSFSIMPRFEYNHTYTLKSLTHFMFKDKSYTQESQVDLDAKHYELAYGLQKVLSPRSYIQLNISAILERKEDGTNVNVDYDDYKFSVFYVNQLTPIYAIDTFAEYRMRDYEDYSSFFENTRSDSSVSISATINAKILDTLRIHLKSNYEKVSSNQEAYDYAKYTISLGLNKTF